MTSTMKEFNAILTIAYRDLLKFLRDRRRLFGALVFPLGTIGGLAGGITAVVGQSGAAHNIFGKEFTILPFIFTGILAQTMFQSAGLGIVSLLEDRENDFSQEIFISPISRYSIVFGKILGESLVSLAQGLIIIIIGVALGVFRSPLLLLELLPAALIACLLGGAFGIMMLSLMGNYRTASQFMGLFLIPQLILGNVFIPLKDLPPVLNTLSLFVPLRYAVDLVRNVFYAGAYQRDYGHVVLFNPLLNLGLVIIIFAVFLMIGTSLFVRSERNR